MVQDSSRAPAPRGLVFALILTGTIVVNAGTDLMLPAVPSLPARLGGSAATAQLVLATYVLGSALGLIGFGELGARYARARLLVVSLLLFAVASLAAGLARSIDQLIVLRFVQGGLGAAPAVFAPGLIRALYGEAGAVAAIGRLGAAESVTPALAPLAGVALLRLWGWPASFLLSGGLALVVAALIARFRAMLPPAPAGATRGGGYGRWRPPRLTAASPGRCEARNIRKGFRQGARSRCSRRPDLSGHDATAVRACPGAPRGLAA